LPPAASKNFSEKLQALGHDLLAHASACIPLDADGYYTSEALEGGATPGTTAAHLSLQGVPSELWVRAILLAIQELSDHAASTIGWILAEFPVSLEHAQALERALNGQPPTSPESNGAAVGAPLGVASSLLAQSPRRTPSPVPPPRLALGAVVRLEVPTFGERWGGEWTP
jgi:hypothetical protein